MKQVSIIIAALLFVAGTSAQQSSASAGQPGAQPGAQQQPGSRQESTQSGQTSTGVGTPASGQSGQSQGAAAGQGQQGQAGQGAVTSPTQRPGQAGQPGLGQGRPGSARQGASIGNQQRVEHLQTAFSQLGRGEKGNEELTRELTMMVPNARTEQIRQVVNDFSRILSRGKVTPEVHQQLASTLAAVLSPQTQPADLQMQINQLQQTLTTAGISTTDAQTLTRNIEMLASQARRAPGAAGASPQSQRSTIEGSRSGTSVPDQGQSGARRQGTGSTGNRQPGAQQQPQGAINP